MCGLIILQKHIKVQIPSMIVHTLLGVGLLTIMHLHPGVFFMSKINWKKLASKQRNRFHSSDGKQGFLPLKEYIKHKDNLRKIEEENPFK
jgi:hypothetical protein